MFSKLIVLIILFYSSFSYAKLERLTDHYRRGGMTLGNLKKIIPALIDDGYYYSALPLMKEYLVGNRSHLDGNMEEALGQIISRSGVKPFEVLPDYVLKSSRSPNILYILAKKAFKNNQPEEAVHLLDRIDDDSYVYPFALHFKGAIYSVSGEQDNARQNFRQCVSASKRFMNNVSDPVRLKQMTINHDYCVAGIARSVYAKKDHTQADLSYLDIPKTSYIWPEVLFEEAWNSYYQKNYNRTLGKLVSYKAPVFDFIFNPEIDVLRALTYLKMCLYNDAKVEVDQFYSDNLEPSKKLRETIMSRGKNYASFYQLITDFEEHQQANSYLETHVLKSAIKDSSYQELKMSLIHAIVEYKNIKHLPNTPLKKELLRGIGEVVSTYKTIIGNYTRGILVQKYADLYRAFKSMSFIKLEVLSKAKEQLYNNDTGPRKRGDVQYIKRNDKQYFWDFNGEFWADELGDYVFALRSEC